MPERPESSSARTRSTSARMDTLSARTELKHRHGGTKDHRGGTTYHRGGRTYHRGGTTSGRGKTTFPGAERRFGRPICRRRAQALERESMSGESAWPPGRRVGATTAPLPCGCCNAAREWPPQLALGRSKVCVLDSIRSPCPWAALRPHKRARPSSADMPMPSVFPRCSGARAMTHYRPFNIVTT